MAPGIGALLLCGPLLLSTGCATIAQGRTQQTAIRSQPAGARIFIDNDLVGITPARIILRRREAHLVLRLEKEGYELEDVVLKRSVSGWIYADIAWGATQFANQGLNSQSEMNRTALSLAVLTLGVDFITGSAYKLPAQVEVTLRPLEDRPH